MIQVNLLTKVYGPSSRQILDRINRSLRDLSAGLKLEAKVAGVSDRGFVQVALEGEDKEVALNYLRQNFGIALSELDVTSVGKETAGKIVKAGNVGYGLYLDLGTPTSEYADALIPLHVLREQLVGGEGCSLRQLIRLFALQDNIPLSVKIVEVDSERNEITARLTDKQSKTYRRWVRSNLDRVIATGVLRENLKRAITKTGHSRDIIRIDSIGLLEHVVVCKEGTEAPGLISSLGPFLVGVPLSTFIPAKIKAELEAHRQEELPK